MPDAARTRLDTRPPAWLDRLSAVSWRFIVVIVAAALVVSAFATLDVILVPAFLALLFASALLPLVRRLRRAGARPGAAAGVGLVTLMAILGIAGAITLSAVAAQASSIGRALDRGMARVEQSASDASLIDDQQADPSGSDASKAAERGTAWLLSGALTVVSHTVDFVTMVLLSIFITFFLLKDGSMMWRWVVDRLGNGSPLLDATGHKAFGALGGYVRGSAIVAAVDAVFIGLGAWLLGVPFPAAIFVLTFTLGFIPYVGAFVAGAFASLLAVADGGMGKGLAMLAIVVVVQQLETNLLQPVIMGKATSLHPLVVALASVAGGAIAGLMGVFVAVPITAAAVAALGELRTAGFFDDPAVRTPRSGEPAALQ